MLTDQLLYTKYARRVDVLFAVEWTSTQFVVIVISLIRQMQFCPQRNTLCTRMTLIGAIKIRQRVLLR